MRIRTAFTARCTPEAAWAALHDLEVAAALYAPLLVMRPTGPVPIRLGTGSDVPVQLRVCGVVPMGRQLIQITDLGPDIGEGWPRTMRDHGRPVTGPLATLSGWRHEVTVSETPGGEMHWADELHIAGRTAWLFRPGLALMWAWRGRRLRRMAGRWG